MQSRAAVDQLGCLEKCESREFWQHEVEQIVERAQVDLDTAREARRAASRTNEWGERWLSTEREAAEQGIVLHPGKLKELFKKAVAPISRVRRLILGEQFRSTAEWYTLIIQELRLRQSLALTEQYPKNKPKFDIRECSCPFQIR